MALKKFHTRLCLGAAGWSVTLAGILLGSAFASALPAKTPAVHLAGVGLGMTKQQVRRILGQPRKVQRFQFEPGIRDCSIWIYRDSLTVEFCYDHFYVKGSDPQGVRKIVTQSPIDRFTNGLHVGSRARAVRRLHPQYCYLPGADQSTMGWRSNFASCTWYPDAGPPPVSVACYPIIEFDFASRQIFRIEVWFSPAVDGCHNFKDLHGQPITLP